MSIKSIVYWAHLESHKDILTEGYIGITKLSLNRRKNKHLSLAFNENHREYNYTFKQALRKYNDEIIWDTIIICNEEDSLLYENKLRPDPNIGWNIAVGGVKNPMQGRKHSKEVRKRMSESRRGKNNPMYGTVSPLYGRRGKESYWYGRNHKKESRKKMSEARRGDSNPMAGKKPWETGLAKHKTLHIWIKADIFYDYWLSDKIIKPKRLANIFNQEHNKVHNKILKRFKEGWNPYKDTNWLEFKKKLVG